MRAVVQRVTQASVTVDGQVIGAIAEPGLAVLVGVTHDDTPEHAAKLAAKLWGLRILDGEKSCSDIGAPLLVISQFTLYADLAKGRRPSWSAAAPGPVAEPLVDAVVAELRTLGARVETGKFGADMKVALINDGPLTIVIDLLELHRVSGSSFLFLRYCFARRSISCRESFSGGFSRGSSIFRLRVSSASDFRAVALRVAAFRRSYSFCLLASRCLHIAGT
jgi:D-aminoacyl-tRNA deacylase